MLSRRRQAGNASAIATSDEQTSSSAMSRPWRFEIGPQNEPSVAISAITWRIGSLSPIDHSIMAATLASRAGGSCSVARASASNSSPVPGSIIRRRCSQMAMNSGLASIAWNALRNAPSRSVRAAPSGRTIGALLRKVGSNLSIEAERTGCRALAVPCTAPTAKQQARPPWVNSRSASQ